MSVRVSKDIDLIVDLDAQALSEVDAMIYIGIDPGKQGAIAKLSTSLPVPEYIHEMPMNGTMYNLGKILELIGRVAHFAVIEQSQPMPKQGVKSCYTIGYGFGILEMALVANGIKYQTVRPGDWKKVMLAGIPKGDTKAMSIQACKRLFPNVSLKRTERCRKDDHNYAEALLLAEYAMRIYRPT